MKSVDMSSIRPTHRYRNAVDRAEIERVMLNFASRARSRGLKLYRSCFADRFQVNFERLTGQPEVHVDADLWTRFAEVILSPVRRHHQYSNFSRPSMAIGRPRSCIWLARMEADGRRQRRIHSERWYENSSRGSTGTGRSRVAAHLSVGVRQRRVIRFSDPELVKIMVRYSRRKSSQPLARALTRRFATTQAAPASVEAARPSVREPWSNASSPAHQRIMALYACHVACRAAAQCTQAEEQRRVADIVNTRINALRRAWRVYCEAPRDARALACRGSVPMR